MPIARLGRAARLCTFGVVKAADALAVSVVSDEAFGPGCVRRARIGANLIATSNLRLRNANLRRIDRPRRSLGVCRL
jgi:hypothetical protein